MRHVALACILLGACSKPTRTGVTAPMPDGGAAAATQGPACGDGRETRVHFYDVGQGLAVLVELPDGRRVLVDTGDDPRRAGCGDSCAASHAHLMKALRDDLHDAPIDLLWITHPHSDHVGGAVEVLESFTVGAFVDNGRDGQKPEVRRARHAAKERGVPRFVVDPGHASVPLSSHGDLRLSAIVPSAWPASCARDANECSIGLRVDYCQSSVLLLGDAEHEEELLLDPGGPVTLLQVSHHGSETSTSPAFLSRARPSYAVLSAGKPWEGINRDYCLPRASIVRRLSRVLGGATQRSLGAFDGDRCDRATADDWIQVPTSDRLWATERDGDVVLTTTGDGRFHR